MTWSKTDGMRWLDLDTGSGVSRMIDVRIEMLLSPSNGR